MDVIATRELWLEDGGTREKVLVNIGRPVRATKGWRCEYAVVGLFDEDLVQPSFGVDEIQAVSLALRIVGVLLNVSLEPQHGVLRFAGSTDLGFPPFPSADDAAARSVANWVQPTKVSRSIERQGEDAMGFDIVATRELCLDEEGESQRVTVNLGRPRMGSAGNWCCEYQIVGLGDDDVYSVIGVDGVQALDLVLHAIGPALENTPAAQQGRLRLDKTGTDFGFPTFRIPSPPTRDKLP
jgi:uncharacterized protein DUF6968